MVAGDIRQRVPGFDWISGPRSLKSYWARHVESIAIAYSASSIEYANGTLIDAMFDGKRFASKPTLIGELIGRARYVGEEVLSRLRDDSLAQNALKALPAVPPLRFEIAPFSVEEEYYIRRQFSG
ncbi:hypothetical protein [Mesorhizobium sp. M7A.F.Ce.TU.012.03.2.1]|uniref:hypothetical protein n=1 Tax=Mesorhizobium sp. M7A.F.Ce.TU.012.03.2.1 TaxID=2493681 RepID=UPI000FD79D94|nr:hypothetical protein [Mesorhizobium sp. M7A.F.Ce.TU.012.03.2.1]AZV18154.1 hypothetical protein EJ079_03120 [Mesorhizobium sp. M7A.F.Ce.TU.012.03.2.1]